MDPYSLAEQELIPCERLVWVGRPDPAALARTRWLTAAVGMFFVLFSLSWLTMVYQIPFLRFDGPPFPFLLIFPIAGLVLLAVGLAQLSSPLRRWRKARRTADAVSDGHVLIIEPGRLQPFEPGDIQQLVRHDSGGGRGDLIFREEQGNLLLAMYTFGATANRKIGFYGMSDVRAAEEAVRKPKRQVA